MTEALLFLLKINDLIRRIVSLYIQVVFENCYYFTCIIVVIWRLDEIPRQKDFVVAIYTSSNPEGYHWHYEKSPSPRVVLKEVS